MDLSAMVKKKMLYDGPSLESQRRVIKSKPCVESSFRAGYSGDFRKKLTNNICSRKDAIRCPEPGTLGPSNGRAIASQVSRHPECAREGFNNPMSVAKRIQAWHRVTDCMLQFPPGIRETRRRSRQNGKNIVESQKESSRVDRAQGVTLCKKNAELQTSLS